MAKKTLTETETREKIKLARKAFQHQLNGLGTELAQFGITLVGKTQKDNFRVAGKPNFLTALTAQIAWRTALIEFIDQLDLDGANSDANIRDELARRHAGIVRSLERSSLDVASRATKMAQTVNQCLDEGKQIPFGQKAREGMVGDHARLLKDMAIVGFIQQFGIASNAARRQDL